MTQKVLGYLAIAGIAAVFVANGYHPTTVAPAATTTTAREEIASTIAIIAMSNDHCYRISPDTLSLLTVMAIGNENVDSEIEKLTAKFERTGWGAFCQAYTPLVKKALANF